MGLIYEKKKDDEIDVLDFMKVAEAQQATRNLMAGETVSPLPYDVEKKKTAEKQIEKEQRPK